MIKKKQKKIFFTGILWMVSLLLCACQTEPSAESGEKRDASVSFSYSSGIYEKPFTLEMSAVTPGDIYYTLDGSNPCTSETAELYEHGVAIKDRAGDPNVVSAVDPDLFSGNFSIVDTSRKNFYCKYPAASDNQVDKCTVVRAAVKKADGTWGREQSGTYFLGTGEEHILGLKESCEASGQSLAVISISMNFQDLFDSATGIYVKGDIFDQALEEYLKEKKRLSDGETARALDANYKQKGREWEREAVITMFEFSGDGEATAVLTQNCGIRIQGNYSRSDLQKGFRLYARTEYGEKNFYYPVFGEDCKDCSGQVIDKFDTLVLRNGGNCAFTSKFNDTYWQSLLTDVDCSTQISRPCVVYLNGEYWGLYILQEDYTDDYMEDHYHVNKEDVVIYKGDAESLALGYKLDEGEIPEGEEESYYYKELLGFFATHESLEAQEDYDAFVKLVDPDSFMDYFAVQCWIDNKWDWPGKNWSMWRTITVQEENPYGDGRWRMMFYDIEFGGVCGGSDAANNTIKNANYKTNGLLDMNTDNPAVLCFAYLMSNEGFREAFCERLTGLSSGLFEKNAALARLEEFNLEYGPLFRQFFQRYEGTGSTESALDGGYATSRCIRDFLSRRAGNIQKQIDFIHKVYK